MSTSTPLIDRINARRKLGRIGPVSPTPIGQRMSEFSRRLAEKRLAVKDFRLGSFIPDGSTDAA